MFDSDSEPHCDLLQLCGILPHHQAPKDARLGQDVQLQDQSGERAGDPHHQV